MRQSVETQLYFMPRADDRLRHGQIADGAFRLAAVDAPTDGSLQSASLRPYVGATTFRPHNHQAGEARAGHIYPELLKSQVTETCQIPQLQMS